MLQTSALTKIPSPVRLFPHWAILPLPPSMQTSFMDDPWPWNPCQRSLKVIGTDTDRSATYNFLLTFHSNHVPISHHFRWFQLTDGHWTTAQHRAVKIIKEYSILTSNSKNIVLCWIPDHVDISGNDKADSAAMSAISLPIINWKFLLTEIMLWAVKYCREEWQEIWDCCECNKHHAIYSTIGTVPQNKHISTVSCCYGSTVANHWRRSKT